MELQNTTNYERVLLGIPALAVVLIWLWIGNMNLMQSPGGTLTLLGLATILGTAAVAASEVSKRPIPSENAIGQRSPKAWFFIIAIVWIVGYPMYMHQRRSLGLKSQLIPSIVLAVAFLGSWHMMSSAIEGKKAEIRYNIDQVRRRLHDLNAR